MKKRRMFVRWILLILGIITLVDIVLVIVEPTSPTETTTEIIMLMVSVAALVAAIISQVDASREEKRLYKIIDGLKEINDKDEKELDHQTTMTRKINELLEADQRIEKELKHRSKKRHFKIKKAAKILLGFVALGSLLSALPASALAMMFVSVLSAIVALAGTFFAREHGAGRVARALTAFHQGLLLALLTIPLFLLAVPLGDFIFEVFAHVISFEFFLRY